MRGEQVELFGARGNWKGNCISLVACERNHHTNLECIFLGGSPNRSRRGPLLAVVIPPSIRVPSFRTFVEHMVLCYGAWIRSGLAAVPFGVACSITERYWTARTLAEFFLQIASILLIFVVGVVTLFWREMSLGLNRARWAARGRNARKFVSRIGGGCIRIVSVS